MPNWCANYLTFMGSQEEIDKLRDYVSRTETTEKGPVFYPFSFEAILPCPPELHQHNAPQIDTDLGKQFIEKYGASDWYQWQVNNWGTKWDSSNSYLDYHDEESAYWYFSTAWCPPEGIYQELASRFPNLSISWFYDEPGMQIAGYLNNPNN